MCPSPAAQEPGRPCGPAVPDAVCSALVAAVRDVGWSRGMDSARTAVLAAALARSAFGRISDEHFNTLYGPWASVMEQPQQ